jgi:hypothetical protein
MTSKGSVQIGDEGCVGGRRLFEGVTGLAGVPGVIEEIKCDVE